MTDSELMKQTALAEHWRKKYLVMHDRYRDAGSSVQRDSAAVLAFIAGCLMGATIAAWWLS